MWTCNNCNETILGDAQYCPKCMTVKGFTKKANLGASSKPSYLNHLKTLARLSLASAIFGVLVFAFSILAIVNREENNSIWILGLVLMIEGFLAYGLLNAIADIAENMIDVGNYVRELRKQDKT